MSTIFGETLTKSVLSKIILKLSSKSPLLNENHCWMPQHPSLALVWLLFLLPTHGCVRLNPKALCDDGSVCSSEPQQRPLCRVVSLIPEGCVRVGSGRSFMKTGSNSCDQWRLCLLGEHSLPEREWDHFASSFQ